MKILSNLSVSGLLGLNSVSDANTDTDKFLVLDSSGIVRYRTGAELFSDIGAGGAAAYTSVLQHTVKAGETLTKGQAVYVTSADGTNMIVGKASNATEATSSKTLGLIAQNLATNDQGFVITEGLLAGLDTSTANAGDPVWLGTGGNLIFGLANKPYAPTHLVFIGIVTRVQQNNGEIFVKVQNGFELQEIHNVQITSTPSDNTVLAYETSTSLYKMKSIPTLLGYTPTTNARNITINGTTYDLSADRSWSVGTHTGNLTTGYVPKATGATSLADSLIYDNGSAIGINTPSPYESATFKLDVNGGVIIKNTNGTTAQLVLINSNPASGGNNGFVQLTAGGTTSTTFAQWQTYYGMSVAAGALRLQPAGGQVLIGTSTASAFLTDINGTLRVSGQLTLGSTISNNTYVYTMPGATGTLALLSDIPSLSGYLTISSAAATYLTQSNAAATYLTQTSASNTYLTLTNATATYLSQTNAASTYLTLTNAASTYLSQTSAASTYLTLTNASSTYLTQTNASNTYVSLSGSYANPSWITSLAWSKITGAPAFLTSYTETDTLATVTGRGATTSNTIQIGKLGIGRAAGSNESISVENPEGTWLIQGFRSGSSVGGLHTNSGILYVQAADVRIQASSTATWNGDLLATRPWVTSQGYITGYTETDTLASVTARGATTSTETTYYGGLRTRKSQTAGNYTTAALWTESYDNTATGIAFHISGVKGTFLEMRTNQVLYWDGNTVLHDGNYSSYSPTLTGGGASGTWGISITGSAGSTNYLSALGDYVFDATTNGRSFNRGIQTSFVSASQSYPSYGSVVRIRTYTGVEDGGTAELYFPYNSTYGGSSMRYRMGQYANAGWTNWKTVIDSDNIGSQSVNYASSAGNADTVDGYHASGLLKLNEWNGNIYIHTDGRIYGTIFYDANDSGYYLDPNNSGKALNIAGNIDLIARSASWAEGIRVRVPSTSTWGGIRFTRDRGNNDGNWAIGYTGVNSSDDLTFWADNGGDGGSFKLQMDKAGNSTFQTSVRAPIFYDSNNTGYYGDFASTSNFNVLQAYSYQGNANVAGTGSASYHPSGIYSTGTNWLYGTMYLNNNSLNDVYQISHTNGRIRFYGNFHFDSYNGNDIYLNYYTNANIRIYGTTYLNSYSIYGGSYISANTSGAITVGDNSATYTYNDNSTRSRVYISSAYPVLTLNSTVTSGNSNHGPTIQFTHNGYSSNRQWVIGTPGTGAQLDIGTAQTNNYNPHYGIAGLSDISGKTIIRVTTAGNTGIGGNWGYYGIGDPSYPLHVVGYSYFDTNVGIAAGPRSDGYKLNMGGSIHLNGNSVDYVGSLYFNGAGHIQPNEGSYGALQMTSSKNGWAGIRFTESEVNLMMNSNESGHYRNGYGWQYRWYNGTFYISTGGQGGGSEYTVIHSGNIGSQSVNYASSAGNADTVDGIHGTSFVRNDTSGQYLKAYYEYGNYLTSQSPLDLVNQGLAGGGLRVDFMHPSYAGGGSWNHVITWSGYNGYNMYQLGGYYDGGTATNLYVRSEANHGRTSWTSWRRLLNEVSDPYAVNMNQYVRTTDSPTFNFIYANYNMRMGEMWGYGGIYRGNGDMMFGVESGGWRFHYQNVQKVYIGTDGNIWMAWAGDYISNLLAAKQNASSAINTSNIGSQSVNYASTVGINYSNDSNSTYQLLWGSGNSIYGTAQVYVNPSSDVIYARGGYVSPGNPWGTSDSAFFPNGITTAGGQNWIYGGTYIGNAPSNGSGVLVNANGSSYFRSSNTSGTWGYAGQFVDRNNASNNYIPWSFESEYGNHSWGIVARFHIQQANGDRPSIQFSSASSNTRWSVGYCYADDNFRITQNHGYRIDNSTNDGWGTERFVINTSGEIYASNFIQSSNSFRAPIFYDSADTGYYLDPNGSSVLSTVYLVGTLRNNGSVADDDNFGLYFDSGASTAYAIYREAGSWSWPYPDLRIAFHTGIKIGANANYGGMKFYSDYDMSTIVASINDGDTNMRGYYDIIAYASDRRLKENVKIIENPIDKVKCLTGMTYTWNSVGAQYGWSPSNEREAGVFAQDVQAVLPEAVRLAPFDNNMGVSKSGQNFLTVKYEKIVPLLIEAIKEQQKQIEDLKGQLNGITK